MTFREAQMELVRMAKVKNEEYVRLAYSEQCAHGEQISAACEGYIHGYGLRSGATWEEVLTEFSKVMDVPLRPYQGPEMDAVAGASESKGE